MILTHPSEVKALLAELNLRPSKAMGQNFLIDANILKIMLVTANLHQADAVLEVGPGLGVLTEWLGRWSGRVLAIEKDRKLFAYLDDRFRGVKTIEIVEGDAAEIDLDGFLARGFNKVVSNLPYSVASRILVSLAQARRAPEQIVVTVQKEVAERLAAATGTKDYGILSVFVQLAYDVEIRKLISPTCFYPPPDVRSAIVNMTLKPERLTPANPAVFSNLLKTAFSQRRKQLGTILKKKLAGAEPALAGLDIDVRTRPEELSPAQWVALADALSAR